MPPQDEPNDISVQIQQVASEVQAPVPALLRGSAQLDSSSFKKKYAKEIVYEDLSIEMRRATFDIRIQKITEENKFYSVPCLIIFVIYSIMLVRFQDDMWAVHRKYPGVVTFLISSTCIAGFEFFWAAFDAVMYTFDYGLKTCKC